MIQLFDFFHSFFDHLGEFIQLFFLSCDILFELRHVLLAVLDVARQLFDSVLCAADSTVQLNDLLLLLLNVLTHALETKNKTKTLQLTDYDDDDEIVYVNAR